MTARIAIVEDEEELAALVRDYLQQAGYRTRLFGNGAEALAAFRQTLPDLIVLDLMLPGMDGIAVCQALREFSDVPVIMVTARVEEIDRLLGLDSGADDYLCKPFSPRELVARVRAILRRPRQPELDGAQFRVDPEGRRVFVRGLAMDLTPTEFLLLAAFLDHPGQIFSRARLLDIANPDDLDVTDRAVDSHIKNLRKKLGEFFPEEDLVESVYGVGYRFELPG